jgi:hypothetical protein
MKRPSRVEEREQRITMEIVVDAYTPEEQAMGWYYSLEDRLHFPFVAWCTAERAISPLRVGDEVDVVGIAPEEECQHEMFVLIRWQRRGPCGSLGPVGGRRGGRADPPGDRGLAVLGRSGLRAVSNADLERGPGGPPRRSALRLSTGERLTGRQESVSLAHLRSEVTWENGAEHSGSPCFADTEEVTGSNPVAPTSTALTSGNAG